jgi:two-component system, sensor histidine kinase and response regulator
MTDNNIKSVSCHDILIVDDSPANLMLLGQILKDNGYKVRPVLNGNLALKVAEKEKPDLILLDINMPDLDGFEVCKRLKQNPNLCDIPVIFISASNNTDDVVKALNSGGADYIGKPFQLEEVLARVETHIKIYKQTKILREINDTKNKFFSIIAHDLRGPLGGFMGLTELIANSSRSFSIEEKNALLLDLSHSARNIFSLLENLLEWSQIQNGNTIFNPQEIDLAETVRSCVNTVNDPARKKSIELIVDIPGESTIYADPYMLQSTLRNLISNAIKFTPKNGRVTISSSTDENNATIVVIKDTGIGIDRFMLDNLFLISENCRRRGTEGELSTGLGLLLCKEFIEKHGGKIWVESEEGKGSSFFFSLPDIRS